jgi:hypothetical protein
MLSNSTYLTKLLVDAHIDDLRRAAGRARLGRAATQRAQRPSQGPPLGVTIRSAAPAVAPLRRPAQSEPDDPQLRTV